MPTFLEKVTLVLARDEGQNNFGGVVTQTVAVHERFGADKITEQYRKPFNSDLREIDLAALVVGNRFTNNSMVIHRKVFTAVGNFREDLTVLYDWEFNIRAVARFHFGVVPEGLACYHLRPLADLNQNTSIEEHLRVKIRIRNEWLRADLAAGRLGLGQLALAGEMRGFGAILDLGRRWRNWIRSCFGGWSR